MHAVFSLAFLTRAFPSPLPSVSLEEQSYHADLLTLAGATPTYGERIMLTREDTDEANTNPPVTGFGALPTVPFRVCICSKLPLPLYADVQFHIPMTHDNEQATHRDCRDAIPRKASRVSKWRHPFRDVTDPCSRPLDKHGANPPCIGHLGRQRAPGDCYLFGGIHLAAVQG